MKTFDLCECISFIRATDEYYTNFYTEESEIPTGLKKAAANITDLQIIIPETFTVIATKDPCCKIYFETATDDMVAKPVTVDVTQYHDKTCFILICQAYKVTNRFFHDFEDTFRICFPIVTVDLGAVLNEEDFIEDDFDFYLGEKPQ